MRIGMVAPLAEAVPPRKYGGTERVVSALTEELVRRGHDVALFASADSRTNADLVPCSPRALRMDQRTLVGDAYQLAQLGAVYERAADFDVIHNHLDYPAFAFARLVQTPTISTTHGRLDLPHIRLTYDVFHDHRLVGISRNQQRQLPDANWAGMVYNGIETDNFHFRDKAGDYLVFLGRISPEKRPDRAIEIARETGMRLVIAAKVDPADENYYEAAIAPLIRACPLVEFVGEVDERGKDQLLGGAYAYLFPIDWPEPFGLTMVEAMATGTPVIAYRAGSAPEIVLDGVTGFICSTLTGMVEAVSKIGTIDRAACRRHVERRFSVKSMVDGYEEVYARMDRGRVEDVRTLLPAIGGA
jgi:glycosyltransferase involved in cell wall biosynthesis